MAFGPLGSSSARLPVTQEEACAVATTVAHRLVVDLHQAQAATGRWSDEALGQFLVEAALDRCLAELATTGLWGRDNQGPSHKLWRIAGPLLDLGDLQHRARFKPLGYAGDFEMLADFWLRKATDATPLGRLFDRYFLKQAAVEAVRSRMELAAAAIAKHCLASEHEEFRVVSIGSGPALDLFAAAQALPTEARRRLRLTLLDLDEQALAAACTRLTTVVATGQVVARRENLFRLATLRGGATLPHDVDLVLCSGLFDYLADDVATAQVRLYWNALRPGGLSAVGNFAPHCPSRAYMEWIGNWYLIYRTADDLIRLADAAEIPPAARCITADRTGCDLFLIAEKS